MACHDFIKQTEKRDNISVKTDLLSLSACIWVWAKPIAFDRSNAMLALSSIFKFSAKNITVYAGGISFSGGGSRSETKGL